jgi:4-amino-4-deoxy-L-arabinose transferase-like glycosyltransferase
LSSLRRRLPFLTLVIAIAAFYLYKLDGAGLFGPDEPRYAAIGETMARTGDFVTPRLWGTQWFEKPPLLYWMTAAGALFGLNPDLAARLPVALLSLAFLGISFWLLQPEFGFRVAATAIALLATSAGWIVYSGLCLTDLPLAVFFSFSVFLALPLLRNPPDLAHIQLRFGAIGVCTALAILAKGLVPVALAIPFLWFLKSFWRHWWIACAACLVIALPWYLALYVGYGYPFLQEFFWKHHIERLYSASLQHVQPWYYYFPVLLLGLFPWTPLLGLLLSRQLLSDVRNRFLASVFVFGFVIFSATLNKLPGYLLPLIPSLFVLVAVQARAKCPSPIRRAWLIPCALLIAVIPLLAPILPPSLTIGRFSMAAIKGVARIEWFLAALPVLIVFLARRPWIGLLLALCVVCGGIYLKTVTYPVLDQQVSARGLWRGKIRAISNSVCDGGTNRDWVYGLGFYRGSLLPTCGTGRFRFVLRSEGHGSPVIEPLH